MVYNNFGWPRWVRSRETPVPAVSSWESQKKSRISNEGVSCLQSNGKQKHIVSILLILLGNALVALGVSCFVLPSGLVMGGATGIGLIGNHFFGADIAVVTYIINIFFFIIGRIFKGKRFAAGIIISTLTYPGFLFIFKSIPNFHYSGSDIMLSAIFAGIIIGVGEGLILRNGSSSGGIEVMNIIINDKTGIPIAALVNIVDIAILAVQALFSSVEQVLYGIILTFLLSMALNRVLFMGEKKVQVTVISPGYDEIRRVITAKMDLGCTFLEIETGYVMEEQKAVMCVLGRRKLTELYQEILAIDPKAFIITAEVNNVKGRGFSLPKIRK